jgi:2-keto-4-pentenoate hydratase/2-oxohepta-3-ene-1,7-dioic acid hydratase in catechol pathway
MRFVFYDDFTPGLEANGQVYDISSKLDRGNHGLNSLLASFIQRHKEIKLEGSGKPLDSVRLRAPVPEPVQLLCAVVNYKEPGRDNLKDADFFLKSQRCIIGNGDIIVLPPDKGVTVFHHEAEFAVVIGKEATNVPASKAMDYIFGYTGFIDVSARGLGGFYKGKSWPTFAPMGPALVTADEIPDPHNVNVRLSVNGEPRQNYNTSDMNNRIDRLIEVASAVTPLLPGDVIATGTHHLGLGPLQDGDEVTLEVEHIGKITHKVQDSLKRKWDPHTDGRKGPIG